MFCKVMSWGRFSEKNGSGQSLTSPLSDTELSYLDILRGLRHVSRQKIQNVTLKAPVYVWIRLDSPSPAAAPTHLSPDPMSPCPPSSSLRASLEKARPSFFTSLMMSSRRVSNRSVNLQEDCRNCQRAVHNTLAFQTGTAEKMSLTDSNESKN